MISNINSLEKKSSDMNELDMETLDSDLGDSSELMKLKEKVRALEKQNKMLKDTKPGDSENGASASGLSDDKIIEDVKLIEIEDLDGSEDNWLLDVSKDNPPEFEELDDTDCSWLRKDVMSPDSLAAMKKKSLVNKLDDIAKKSPVRAASHLLNSPYRLGGLNTSFPQSSPYTNFTTSPPSAKYAAPASASPIRGQGFDPRTFTRPSATRAGAYSLPPEEAEAKIRKSSYHRLNFGAKTEEENFLNTTYDRDNDGKNATFDMGDKLNSTFNKTSDIITDNHCNELNATYERNTSVTQDGLNSTFTRNGRGGGGGAHNATFERGGNNATFNRGEIQPGLLNATFEKDGGSVNGGANHRKMSEDRLSSASSSCDVSNRLSRESSQDILVEDLDRLSTTSAMSESSVSHRLNDVQDVQDIARMQEESLKHSTPLKNQRSDTISPLSEQSLSSPVEDGGGYQSEESCGSESGSRGQGPIRGQEARLGVYSSQDSLPDSPYSSQSLDSHASNGHEVRRSMPNLNKLRGGKVGPGARPGAGQYGMGGAKYHNSESRLQHPQSRMMQAPVRGLRAPGATSGLLRPGTVSGLRPPGAGERKLSSGIARPQGLPRPTSKLQPPGSYMRSGLPMRGAPGGGRAPSHAASGRKGTAEAKNWIEDCY